MKQKSEVLENTTFLFFVKNKYILNKTQLFLLPTPHLLNKRTKNKQKFTHFP